MSSKLFWFDKPLFRNEEPLRYTGYNEYRSSGAEPRMSGVNYSRYTEPIHRYSRYSEPTPRYSRYSDPTTPDDRSYCRTTVSWDGATRVTQKSCFQIWRILFFLCLIKLLFDLVLIWTFDLLFSNKYFEKKISQFFF